MNDIQPCEYDKPVYTSGCCHCPRCMRQADRVDQKCKYHGEEIPVIVDERSPMQAVKDYQDLSNWVNDAVKRRFPDSSW